MKRVLEISLILIKYLKKSPGKIHPGLRRDILLNEQINLIIIRLITSNKINKHNSDKNVQVSPDDECSDALVGIETFIVSDRDADQSVGMRRNGSQIIVLPLAK